MKADTNNNIPKTDSEVIALLKTLTASNHQQKSLCLLYEGRRKQKETILQAYAHTLKVFADVILQNL